MLIPDGSRYAGAILQAGVDREVGSLDFYCTFKTVLELRTWSRLWHPLRSGRRIRKIAEL